MNDSGYVRIPGGERRRGRHVTQVRMDTFGMKLGDIARGQPNRRASKVNSTGEIVLREPLGVKSPKLGTA